MKLNRRTLLKGTGGAAIALAAPNLVLSPAKAQAWINPGGPIKVGVLFSQSGSLAVVENDSTQVVQFAIDEINANGGIGGMQVEPVVIDAKSDIRVYS